MNILKSLMSKIKYIFKGNDDKVYALESESEISIQSNLKDIKLTESEKLEVSVTSARRVITGIDNYFKVIRLTRILINTRKPRVKKKLAKRIAKLKKGINA